MDSNIGKKYIEKYDSFSRKKSTLLDSKLEKVLEISLLFKSWRSLHAVKNTVWRISSNLLSYFDFLWSRCFRCVFRKSRLWSISLLDVRVSVRPNKRGSFLELLQELSKLRCSLVYVHFSRNSDISEVKPTEKPLSEVLLDHKCRIPFDLIKRSKSQLDRDSDTFILYFVWNLDFVRQSVSNINRK